MDTYWPISIFIQYRLHGIMSLTTLQVLPSISCWSDTTCSSYLTDKRRSSNLYKLSHGQVFAIQVVQVIPWTNVFQLVQVN